MILVCILEGRRGGTSAVVVRATLAAVRGLGGPGLGDVRSPLPDAGGVGHDSLVVLRRTTQIEHEE